MIDTCESCGKKTSMLSIDGTCPSCTANKVMELTNPRPLHLTCAACGYNVTAGIIHQCNAQPVSDPKATLGVHKFPMSAVPACVMGEVGVAMLEGALKYGAFNYRKTGIEASTYYDAVNRHIKAWWEGEDFDVDSGMNHITKAIATLIVMRDSMINDKLTDNRPPRVKAGWVEELNQKTKELLEKYGK